MDLGIRPEHIYIIEPHRHTERTEEEYGKLMVEVKVVEPLGRETLIRGALPGSGTMLNIQAGAVVRLHPSERLFLQLDLSQLFIFDSATGDKLYPQISL